MVDETNDDAGKSQIFRHGAPVPDDAPSGGDPELIDAIDRHISNTIGEVDFVFHEIVSPYVHIDVHHVPPSDERPFHVLVTSGMSEMPMTTPPEADAFRYAELLVCLPAEWPISQESFRDERHYWPVRALKSLARLPHEYGTWLGWGHTVPNGDPPEAYAGGTGLCGMIVLPPLSLDEAAATLDLPDGRSVHFWALVPLHADEMALKLKKGTEVLLPLLDRHGVSDVIDPARPSVVKRRRLWPFRR